ncbi:MAG: beta-ketoadipyl CoA thiolase [spirochete symbiont of Stewartia floridana]|nr:MAG: beta-ketoadipyl CoA thiolase [spirochete symbiont of Stewartia floridana]
MKEVVIIDAVRTPIGRFGGALSTIRPDDLLAHTFEALIRRSGLNPAMIDEVYAGCGNQAGEDNRDVARQAALLAGFPVEVPGITVNRNCASALSAVNLAARTIIAGEGDICIGSGVESMSRAPWSMEKPSKLPSATPPKLWDTTVGWRYNNPRMEAKYPIVSLGETAENIAVEMKISREEQDTFALESHSRAIHAINDGRFNDEIAPVTVPHGRKDFRLFAIDEHPRCREENGVRILDTSLEKLSKLRPAFRKDGTVTAGNSSGINDGAAAVLMMSREKADALGMRPMARWVGAASAGVNPGVMGYGPIPATKKLLKRLSLTLEDIGLVELNEAFAAQTIGVMKQLGLNHEITNVNGGAIALGHPTGCSGARILVTLLHEMKRRAQDTRKPFYGLATLCVGVGMGVSTLVEIN